MKGAISFKGQQFYTDMNAVFQSIHHIQRDYNWLLSSYEFNNDFPGENESGYLWLTGDQITEIVEADHIQFIWGVLSAFHKEILMDDVLQYPLPVADGYRGFWVGEPSIQHPLAEIEIVPWDSTCVLFIAKDNRLVEDFIAHFPNARDLQQFNNSDETLW